MIVFNVRLPSHLPLVREIAVRLKAAGEDFGFCFERGPAETKRMVENMAASLGGRFFDLEALVQAVRSTRPASDTHLPGDESALIGVAPDDRQIQGFVTQLRDRIKASRKLLVSTDADLVVVLQDGAAGNAPLIRAAHDLGIRVLCCPYGFGTSRDYLDYIEEKHAQGTLHRPEGLLGQWIRDNCPGWIHHSTYGEYLMFPPKLIYVRERLGLGVDLPWVVHGGPADVLAAESEQMRDHYVAEGIDPGKIALTGTVYCDVMRRRLDEDPALRSAFEEARKIEPGRTSLLLSIPPSYHATRAEKNEFESYEELCMNLVRTCTSVSNVDVRVSFHPAVSAEHRDLVKSFGVEISDEWILELIPKHDVMLTAFSSTIRWAIACGKPVLNYNMYGYTNQDYEAVPEVFTTRSLESIARRLDDLADDDGYHRAASRQREAAPYWGDMDGRSFERIHAVMDALRTAARADDDDVGTPPGSTSPFTTHHASE